MAEPVLPSAPPPSAVMRQMIFSLWVTRAIYVAAELGIADHLAAGPRTSEELAQAAGADAGALYRALRAAASVGVFTEVEPRRFALNPLGECLRSDVPGSMRALARMMGSAWHWRTWEGVLASMRTGGTAFEEVYQTPFFQFLALNPPDEALFDHAMTSFSSVENDAIRQAYDFTPLRTLVDVGGGRGHLLAALLAGRPDARGILFDRPPVIEGSREALRELGIADRCTLVGGDFFEELPPGGDGYVVKYVLHNWDDARALAILKTCRRAMAPGAKLVVVEQVIPPGDVANIGKLMDLEMLVLVGGRERTEQEFRELFAQAGFSLTRVLHTKMPLCVLEAVPA